MHTIQNSLDEVRRMLDMANETDGTGASIGALIIAVDQLKAVVEAIIKFEQIRTSLDMSGAADEPLDMIGTEVMNECTILCYFNFHGKCALDECVDMAALLSGDELARAEAETHMR